MSKNSENSEQDSSISKEDSEKVNELTDKLAEIKDRIGSLTPNIKKYVDEVKLKALIKVMYSLHTEWPEEIREQVESILDG